jgi:hypothetical protein
MGSLQPHLEIDGCLFTHVEPWLDPHKVEDFWYFDGPPDTPEKLARSFQAVPNRVLFIGHMHRWMLGTPDGLRGGVTGRCVWTSRYGTLSWSMPSGTATVRCSIPRPTISSPSGRAERARKKERGPGREKRPWHEKKES